METILVVDDEPAVTCILAAVLRHHDYLVLTAHDGVEAYAIAASENVDLVISDYAMPHFDGVELTACLACNPGTRKVPVLLMTDCLIDVDHASIRVIEKPLSDIDNFVRQVHLAFTTRSVQ